MISYLEKMGYEIKREDRYCEGPVYSAGFTKKDCIIVYKDGKEVCAPRNWRNLKTNKELKKVFRKEMQKRILHLLDESLASE